VNDSKPPDSSSGPRWRELEDTVQPVDEEPAPGAEPQGEEVDTGDDFSVEGPVKPPPPRLPGPRRPVQRDDSVPDIKLTRWNPYDKVSPAGRKFVKDLMRFPAVSVGIIAVLVFFYAWMVSQGWELSKIQPSRWGYAVAIAFGALEPELVKAGEWWRLFTAALLHGSILHLFVNCFMLYQLGRLAENIFGRMGLIVLFVGSAFTGCLFSAFIGGNMSVGASGGVMGLVGACIAFGLRHRARIPEFLQSLFGSTLYIYALLVLLMGVLPSVDGWGHAGGALGGALLGLVLPSQILRGEGRASGRWIIAPFAVAVAVAGASLIFMLPRAFNFDGKVPIEEGERFDRAYADERWEDAAAALDAAAVVEPDGPLIPMVRIVFGDKLTMEDRWQLAVEQYDKAAESEPELFEESPILINNHAWAVFMGFPGEEERVVGGVEALRRAMEYEPSFGEEPFFLNTLAWGLYLAGEDHDALANVDRSIQISKGKSLNTDIYVQVAALYAIGRENEAVKTYQDAVVKYPGGVLHTEVAAVLAANEERGDGEPFLRTPWVVEEAAPLEPVIGEAVRTAPLEPEPVEGEFAKEGDTPVETPDEAELTAPEQAQEAGAEEAVGDGQWQGRRATWE